jgi:hypothetical protein
MVAKIFQLRFLIFIDRFSQFVHLLSFGGADVSARRLNSAFLFYLESNDDANVKGTGALVLNIRNNWILFCFECDKHLERNLSGSAEMKPLVTICKD